MPAHRACCAANSASLRHWRCSLTPTLPAPARSSAVRCRASANATSSPMETAGGRSACARNERCRAGGAGSASTGAPGEKAAERALEPPPGGAADDGAAERAPEQEWLARALRGAGMGGGAGAGGGGTTSARGGGGAAENRGGGAVRGGGTGS